MKIQEFQDRVKTAKVKELDMIFRTTDGKTLSVSGIFYGVENTDGTVANPQVGEEPNCIVMQVV